MYSNKLYIDITKSKPSVSSIVVWLIFLINFMNGSQFANNVELVRVSVNGLEAWLVDSLGVLHISNIMQCFDNDKSSSSISQLIKSRSPKIIQIF